MDVTNEVNRLIQSMGGGSSANPAYSAINRSLNFAKHRNNIHNAANENITVVPFQITYKDTVGLFGAENVFIKIQLNIQSAATAFANITTAENDYLPVWTLEETGTTNDYDTGVLDFTQDLSIVNTYDPAIITNDLSAFRNPYLSVDLKNLKTGNKYIDNWFDVRIYTADREEYEYDTIYLAANDFFYLGFHARNTRRLPYNVQVDIGNEYVEYDSLSASQKKLTA